jgi:NADPH2:quinone reductase
MAEIDLPPLTPSDVLVEIEYTSLSPGTERWVLTDGLKVPDRPGLAAFPHVPCYQAAGTVREAGEAVEEIQPGDRVFSRNCRAPDGWAGSWWGGHVAFHVVDHQHVIRLPECVTTREASSLLLAQVGYNGATKPRLRAGDVVVVIGAGLVGQYAGQVLRYRGAHVIMCELRRFRLEKAAQHSADDVLNSADEDLMAFIAARYPDGVDIVLETASSNRTIQVGIELLKRGGQLVLNGFYPPGESTLDWHWLRTKEITIYCPNSRTRERLESTLHLIEGGHVKVEELVTHELDATRAPDAYSLLLDQSTKSLGIVLNWVSRR